MTYGHDLHQLSNLALDFRNDRVLRGPSIQRILDALSAEPDDLVVEHSRGDGEYALALSAHMSETRGGGVVFACDPEPERVKRFERQAERLGIGHHLYPVQLNGVSPYRLPFRDEQVDCLLSVDRVPWKLDPRPYLAEYARVLKPYGTLVLAESDRQLRYESPDRVEPLPKSDERYPFLRDVGFDIFSSLNVSNYLWVERAMKPVIVFSA
jgi:ubiquinone/menaquinone biosynthesis C-methylase UbiE